MPIFKKLFLHSALHWYVKCTKSAILSGFGFFVGFQTYVRKRHILEKIQNYFLSFENFSTFFSNLKKNSLKKWFEKRFIHALEIFFWLFWSKMVDFCPKITVFNHYKTLRVSSGLTVGFRFWSGLWWKVGFGAGSGFRQSSSGF